MSKLDHPNVVTLFTTFQDAATLYYQMDFIEGRELWFTLQDTVDNMKHQVGCYWSLAQSYIAEAINALEYMHRLVFASLARSLFLSLSALFFVFSMLLVTLTFLYSPKLLCL